MIGNAIRRLRGLCRRQGRARFPAAVCSRCSKVNGIAWMKMAYTPNVCAVPKSINPSPKIFPADPVEEEACFIDQKNRPVRFRRAMMGILRLKGRTRRKEPRACNDHRKIAGHSQPCELPVAPPQSRVSRRLPEQTAQDGKREHESGNALHEKPPYPGEEAGVLDRKILAQGVVKEPAASDRVLQDNEGCDRCQHGHCPAVEAPEGCRQTIRFQSDPGTHGGREGQRRRAATGMSAPDAETGGQPPERVRLLFEYV